MTAVPLPATDGLEERPSVVEQFDLSEDKEKSIIDQHNEQDLATKWEIWAYYACVAGALVLLKALADLENSYYIGNNGLSLFSKYWIPFRPIVQGFVSSASGSRQ